PRRQQALRSGREGQGNDRRRARQRQGRSADALEEIRGEDRGDGGEERKRDHGTVSPLTPVCRGILPIPGNIDGPQAKDWIRRTSPRRLWSRAFVIFRGA